MNAPSRVGENPAVYDARPGESRTSEVAARLASLTGLSLLEAVFPGRVLKIERPALTPGTDGLDEPIAEPALDPDAHALAEDDALVEEEPLFENQHDLPRRDP